MMAQASNSLSSRNKSFKLVGTHAIAILARLAAKRAVQDEQRAQGVRVTLVRPAEIAERAKVYLEQHPELYQQALERAKQMELIQPPMVTPDRAAESVRNDSKPNTAEAIAELSVSTA